MGIYNRAAVYWISIEGLMDPASGRLRRFSTGPITGDTDAVYHRALINTAPISSSIDLRADAGSRASIGGLQVQLRASDLVVSLLCRAEPASRIGTLYSAINQSDTTIIIDQVAGLGNLITYQSGALRAVSLGREVIWLTAHTASVGDRHTYTCQRGAAETRARAHGIGVRADVSIFPASVNVAPRLRTVTLGWTPPTGGYAQETVLERYALTAIEQPGLGERVVLTADSALERLRATTLLGGRWRATFAQSFEAPVGVWTARYESRTPGARPVSGRWSGASRDLLVAVDGEAVGVTTWETRGGLIYTALDAQAGTWHPRSVIPSRDDAEAEVWEVFGVGARAPALSSSATATQARLSDHPITLARQLLTTTLAQTPGDPGDNGDWDTGSGVGAGVPESLLDADVWDEAEGAVQLRYTDWVLGLEGDGVGALELVQQILAPTGYLLTCGARGLLTLRRFRAQASGSEVALFESALPAISALGRQGRLLDDPVDEVAVQWDERAGQALRSDTYTDGVITERQEGRGLSLAIFAPGLTDEGEVEGLAVREAVRWRWALATWTVTVLLDAQTEALRAGDGVLVTHRALVGRGGVRGVTQEFAQVLSATSDPRAGEVQLVLLWTGALHQRPRKIAPSAIVQSIAGLVVTTYAHEFSAELAPGQVNDLTGFAVGDGVIVMTRDRATVRGSTTVTAVGAGTLTLAAIPAGTVDGDLLQPDFYTFQSAGQQGAWASMANSSEVLGVSDAAHEWAY